MKTVGINKMCSPVKRLRKSSLTGYQQSVRYIGKSVPTAAILIKIETEQTGII